MIKSDTIRKFLYNRSQRDWFDILEASDASWSKRNKKIASKSKYEITFFFIRKYINQLLFEMFMQMVINNQINIGKRKPIIMITSNKGDNIEDIKFNVVLVKHKMYRHFTNFQFNRIMKYKINNINEYNI